MSCPRYLGPAVSPGAVYIGSQHDSKAEIICFRGNMMTFDPQRHPHPHPPTATPTHRPHPANPRYLHPSASSTPTVTDTETEVETEVDEKENGGAYRITQRTYITATPKRKPATLPKR
jgi:hypothetical protein